MADTSPKKSPHNNKDDDDEEEEDDVEDWNSSVRTSSLSWSPSCQAVKTLPATPNNTPTNLVVVKCSSRKTTAKTKVNKLPVLAKTVLLVTEVYAKLALYVQLARNQTGAMYSAA